MKKSPQDSNELMNDDSSMTRLDDPAADLVGVRRERGPEHSILLATGSSDPYVYIYDVGGPQGELVQRLPGHSDRVYSVCFHPLNPILASCSADFTIKVWVPKNIRAGFI